MQISNILYSNQSYKSSSSPTSPKETSEKASSLSDFAGLTDYDSTKNTIFQNLLKDKSVQQDVALNEDGSYTFHFNVSDGPLNDRQFLAKMLVLEQNGASEGLSGTPLSKVDRERFRQVTGYNFVQAGGLFTFVDDNGDPPPPSEQARVTAAGDAFMTAKDVQIARRQTGDITAAGLAEMIKNIATLPGANNKMLDDLLGSINKSYSDESSTSVTAEG